MAGSPTKIDAALRTQVIEGAISALHKEYVFPKVAAKIEKQLRQNLKAKRYDSITNADKLAEQLTADLRAVSDDKHLGVVFSADALPDDQPHGAPMSPKAKAQMRTHAGGFNAFFVKVERMPGNIGYLRLDTFAHPLVGAERAAAAMTFVADTDELIIDLRSCGGGDPDMVALLVSYLYDAGESVHVSNIYWRPDDTTRQFWTSPDVAGRRYPDKPVYVLTSSETFSAAEDFAYAIRSLKRGKLVGEVTGGGAHPTWRRRLTSHFAIFVPFGRSISPVTKRNWEGVGVKPHIECEADDALATAYLAALRSQSKRAHPKLKDWVPDLGAEIDQALKKALRKKG